ncbi:MAG: serine/threonine protein kinase [Polyangiales bacterium]
MGVSLGRYTLHAELASGGMASVHLGRLVGDAGFGRTVAIKRLHPQYAKDPEFVRMFVDEARIAARIHHPNVVPTLDVVEGGGEIFLVLEYVKGESLSSIVRTLSRRHEKMPIAVATSIVVGALTGLGAAHDARDAQGEPLHIVHRDISPQNVMVGADGVARLLDFGVAKARARLSTTEDGHLKGKIAYMAPEQIAGGETSPQSDVYAIGVVLWELLAGRRLFEADSEVQLMALVRRGEIHPPSDFRDDVPEALDRICARALGKDPSTRYPSARAMAKDLDASVEIASAMRVSEWITDVVGPLLEARSKLVAEVESGIREVSRDALEAIARATAPSLEEAATKAVATVSSFAKAADSAMRDRARKMADKAAKDVGALATALKVPSSNPILKAALAPLQKKPKEEKTPEPTATRVEKPPKSK